MIVGSVDGMLVGLDLKTGMLIGLLYTKYGRKYEMDV